MEATLDLWDIPPESATKVGHPAPFPVELPKRLIELYTYRGDLVLDPFMGSGSTAVAAVHSDRHFIGYDTNQEYVDAALARVDEERARIAAARQRRLVPQVVLPAVPVESSNDEPFQSRAVREGQRAKEIAYAVLKDCNFVDIAQDQRFSNGVEVNFVARDSEGRRWFFDVSGAFTSTRAGLRRTDTLWKALGKAAVLRSATQGAYRLVFLTTDMPPASSAGHAALKAVRGDVYHDAIQMLSIEGQERLRRYAAGDGYDEPIGELMSSAGEDEDV
jgi:site-specific DNA-methyltransferase (adenine-specific)